MALKFNLDRHADTLYVSVGKPRKAIGTYWDADTTVVRYDEASGDIVGWTVPEFTQGRHLLPLAIHRGQPVVFSRELDPYLALDYDPGPDVLRIGFHGAIRHAPIPMAGLLAGEQLLEVPALERFLTDGRTLLHERHA